MEKEYIILALARLGLLLFSFFALSQCVLMIKAAWQENDQKKMRKGVSLLWGGILAGCIFLKMFGGFR
jgi:hypothetical protein